MVQSFARRRKSFPAQNISIDSFILTCALRPKQRLNVAYHEAGHAVAGVLLRWAIREVSIGPINRLAGYIRHPRGVDDLDCSSLEPPGWRVLPSVGRSAAAMSRQRGVPARTQRSRLRNARARADIAVRLAGPRAERRVTGRWNNRSASIDGWQALEVAKLLAVEIHSTSELIIEQEGMRADRLLKENWQCVHAVADALLAKSRLTGRQVRAIVKSRRNSTQRICPI